MVNRVCQNVSGALEEKSTQTNAHMGLDRLVMSLAKHNALIVETYAMLRIQAGIRILDTGVEEGNSQKRLSAIQMLWSHENGGVDVSLKDGLFSEIAQGSAYSNGYPGNPGINEFMKCEGDSNEEFTGFQQTNPKNGVSRSTTTSPWRSRTPLNVDSIIFNTPRRLVHSLQEPNNADSK
ncbi:hypothetical protein C1H46_034019 [Malus baccata]|uniref:Uncharacterized protein n=1 Tax=Malus baccata TaxID=106549 RepID=A0A540L287_MALBA|nr:hypothetical protein C1H46_034019 [Malus baccata]